jgi:hypothetical protein
MPVLHHPQRLARPRLTRRTAAGASRGIAGHGLGCGDGQLEGRASRQSEEFLICTIRPSGGILGWIAVPHSSTPVDVPRLTGRDDAEAVAFRISAERSPTRITSDPTVRISRGFRCAP